jgi:hypothetical protein
LDEAAVVAGARYVAPEEAEPDLIVEPIGQVNAAAIWSDRVGMEKYSRGQPGRRVRSVLFACSWQDPP